MSELWNQPWIKFVPWESRRLHVGGILREMKLDFCARFFKYRLQTYDPILETMNQNTHIGCMFMPPPTSDPPGFLELSPYQNHAFLTALGATRDGRLGAILERSGCMMALGTTLRHVRLAIPVMTSVDAL